MIGFRHIFICSILLHYSTLLVEASSSSSAIQACICQAIGCSPCDPNTTPDTISTTLRSDDGIKVYQFWISNNPAVVNTVTLAHTPYIQIPTTDASSWLSPSVVPSSIYFVTDPGSLTSPLKLYIFINTPTLTGGNYTQHLYLPYTWMGVPYTYTINVNISIISDFRIDSIPISNTIIEGDNFQLNFHPHTLPISNVSITFNPYKALVDVNGYTPAGKLWRGGGSGLTIANWTDSTTLPVFVFNSTTWSMNQSIILPSIYSPLIQGDRIVRIGVSVNSSDSAYMNLSIPDIPVYIKEKNSAAIVFDRWNFTISKLSNNVINKQNIMVTLTSQPLADVVLTFTNSSHYSFSPLTITFTSTSWNVPQVVQLLVLPNNIIEGTNIYNISFPTPIQSADYDYNGLLLPNVFLTILDNNLVFSSISPTYGASGGGDIITVTWPSTSSFNSASLGQSRLPSVICRFGLTDTTPQPGVIVSENSVQCTSPKCADGMDILGEPCLTPVILTVTINGQSTTNTQQYNYIQPADVAAINSVTPSTLDTSTGGWITLTGTHFDRAIASLVRCRSYVSNSQGVSATPVPSISTKLITTTLGGNNNNTGILCFIGSRPDLGGSTTSISMIVEVALNGQDYTSSGKTFNFYDYDTADQSTKMIIFWVVINMAILVFIILALKRFLCVNCGKNGEEEDDDYRKTRVVVGPQLLIEYLEPKVMEAQAKLAEIEAVERVDAEKEEEKALDAQRKQRIKELRADYINNKKKHHHHHSHHDDDNAISSMNNHHHHHHHHSEVASVRSSVRSSHNHHHSHHHNDSKLEKSTHERDNPPQLEVVVDQAEDDKKEHQYVGDNNSLGGGDGGGNSGGFIGGIGSSGIPSNASTRSSRSSKKSKRKHREEKREKKMKEKEAAAEEAADAARASSKKKKKSSSKRKKKHDQDDSAAPLPREDEPLMEQQDEVLEEKDKKKKKSSKKKDKDKDKEKDKKKSKKKK